MEKTEVEKISIKETLINHRNKFQKGVIDNALDLQRHIEIFQKDRNYQRQNQNGKFIGVEEIIENYRKELRNAQSYVDIIDSILAKETEAEMLKEFARIADVIPSPVKVEEEGK